MTVEDVIKIIRDFSDELREEYTSNEVKDYGLAEWPEIAKDVRRSARWGAILELQNRISDVWLNEIEVQTEV